MIRTTAIAAALALAAGTFTTPALAGNNHLGAALLGGFVAGALVANSSRYYGQPAYGYQQHCWKERQFVGYDYNGYALYQNVRVCQ